MDYTQVKQPNVSVAGKDGLCLAYVTEVFGVAAKYPTAIEGWEDAAFKHAGATPPANVAVPVWFSYNGPDGHVAVWVPGKGIYSTSAQGDKVFASIEALVSWMGEGMTYLGWSEDLNGVRVVTEVSIPAPSAPAPAPALKPSTVSASGTYAVTKPIQGFGNANEAANHLSPADTVQPGNYAIFNEADGMINVTSKAGEPGSWINPADNEVTEAAKVVTVQPGWGEEAIAQAANLKSAGQESTWQAIAKANGSNDWHAFNAALKPGQKVVIPEGLS